MFETEDVFEVFCFSPYIFNPNILLHTTDVIYEDALAADVCILKLYFMN